VNFKNLFGVTLRTSTLKPAPCGNFSTASLQSSGVVSFLDIRAVVTLYRHVCITTNYTDTTSNHKHNSKQHAVVSIHLQSHVLRMNQCCNVCNAIFHAPC